MDENDLFSEWFTTVDVSNVVLKCVGFSLNGIKDQFFKKMFSTHPKLLIIESCRLSMTSNWISFSFRYSVILWNQTNVLITLIESNSFSVATALCKSPMCNRWSKKGKFCAKSAATLFFSISSSCFPLSFILSLFCHIVQTKSHEISRHKKTKKKITKRFVYGNKWTGARRTQQQYRGKKAYTSNWMYSTVHRNGKREHHTNDERTKLTWTSEADIQ